MHHTNTTYLSHSTIAPSSFELQRVPFAPFQAMLTHPSPRNTQRCNLRLRYTGSPTENRAYRLALAPAMVEMETQLPCLEMEVATHKNQQSWLTMCNLNLVG